MSQCHGFNAKSVLKMGHPGPRYLSKQNGVAIWFCVPCLNFFLQISRHRVVRFSNRSLLWNRGIETVVLSTIIGTNRVFKYPKKIPESFKNRLKNPKLRENLTWFGKKGFIFRHMWLLIEWNHVKYSRHLLFSLGPKLNTKLRPHTTTQHHHHHPVKLLGHFQAY